MESSSSPPSNKDCDKTTPTTVTAEAGRDDSDFYSLSSPLHLLQEAVRFVLRCLGFERENPTHRAVESSSHGSGEKETEVKGKSSPLPSPQRPGGGGGGQGDGGSATASLDPPTTSAADDPPPSEAGGGDPTAAADDPPSTAAQDNTLVTAAFRTPTRPPINPGQGGQHN